MRADAAHLDEHRALLPARALHAQEALLALGLVDHFLAEHEPAQALGEQVRLDRQGPARLKEGDLFYRVAPHEKRAGRPGAVELGEKLGEGRGGEIAAQALGGRLPGELLNARRLLARALVGHALHGHAGELLAPLRHAVELRVCLAQRRPQGRLQLGQAHGLFEEFGDAELLPEPRLVRRRTVGAREEEDGDRSALGGFADPPCDLEAVEVGQGEVEQHRVDPLVLKGSQRPLAFLLHQDREPFAGQRIGEEALHGPVVVDNQGGGDGIQRSTSIRSGQGGRANAAGG